MRPAIFHSFQAYDSQIEFEHWNPVVLQTNAPTQVNFFFKISLLFVHVGFFFFKSSQER